MKNQILGVPSKFIIILLFLGCSEPNATHQPISSKSEARKVVPASSSNDPENEEEKSTANGLLSKEETLLLFDSTVTIEYIMGRFDPSTHSDFTKIATKHANRADRLLRKEAYEAFIQMYEAAKKEGINLKIISATRNFATQKTIWEGKWTGKRLQEGKENLAKTTPDSKERALKILKWSSMPGTSRHHWGTDIDLNNLTNKFFEKGEGLKIYNWLVTNASNYGFCQPYSPKGEEGRPHGYNEEKWHWSYLPIAKKMTEQVKLRLTDELITGFKGSETAKSIGVVDKFILGINEACL